VPIDATSGVINSGGGAFAGQSLPRGSSSLPQGQTATSTAAPEDVSQLCRPSTQSLDLDHVQSLADCVAFNSLTQNSLDALSKAQGVNDQLMKLLNS
jgi:hypothetical protein